MGILALEQIKCTIQYGAVSLNASLVDEFIVYLETQATDLILLGSKKLNMY